MSENFRQKFKNRSLAAVTFFSLFFGYLLLLPGISNETHLFMAALFAIFILNPIPFLLGKSVKDDQHPYPYFVQPIAMGRVYPYSNNIIVRNEFQTLFYSKIGLLAVKSIYLLCVLLFLMALYFIW